MAGVEVEWTTRVESHRSVCSVSRRQTHHLEIIPIGAGRAPGARATSLAPLARYLGRMLRHLGTGDAARALVIGPSPSAPARALRAAGFRGEIWAPADPPPWGGPVDRVRLRPVPSGDRPDAGRAAGGGVGAPAIAGDAATPGDFEIVLALDALDALHHLVPEGDVAAPVHLAALMADLAALMAPLACLIVSEPLPAAWGGRLEAALLPLGMVLAADPIATSSAGRRYTAAFQTRGVSQAAQVDLLRRVTLAQINRTPALRRGLIQSFREVFGGPEWREWARCTRPGCGRQYGRRDVEALDPAGRCTCGWPEPLVPCHPPGRVLEQLRRELGDPAGSCCYVRTNAAEAVEAFGWGYAADLDGIVRELAPPGSSLGRRRLRERTRRALRALGADPRTARVFYFAESGAIAGVRSFSLARAMCLRVLRHAADAGMGAFMLRSTPESAAYPLMAGLGMRTLLRYDDFPDVAADGGPDRRVVLWGRTDSVVGMLTRLSDHQVALRIAHWLRAARHQGETR